MTGIRFAPLALLGALACGAGAAHDKAASASPTPLVIFNAGSLARPLKAAADSFAVSARVAPQQESAGSLETARKLTELGKVPDIIALADAEVFPGLLMPSQVSWYARFARNRMVVAYTDRSKFAKEITPENWYRVLQRPGVEVGRSDPDLDPAGYRALLVWQLAERQYSEPGLASRLLARAGGRNVRQKSADLVALVQAGELDYAWEYESVARAAGLRVVRLPARIDLSDPADSAFYAQAVVRVRGKTPRDTLVMRGLPIVYGFSIPLRAPHPDAAPRFAAYLASDAGRRVMRSQGLDVLDRFEVVGTGAPAEVGR